MSYVTDIIILTCIDSQLINDVQNWLDNHGMMRLKEVSDCSETDRAMQCNVWIGAYNYFHCDEFIKAILEIEWHDFDYMILSMKTEEEGWGIIKIPE